MQQSAKAADDPTNRSQETALKKRKYMEILKEAQSALSSSQQMIWLVQALVELDTDSTQDIIDNVVSVLNTTKECHASVTREQIELKRLQVEC